MDMKFLHLIHPLCTNGHLECLKYLMSVDVQYNRAYIDILEEDTTYHMNGLLMACNANQSQIMKYLINDLNYLNNEHAVHQCDINGKNLVWMAATHGNLTILELLLEKGYVCN